MNIIDLWNTNFNVLERKEERFSYFFFFLLLLLSFVLLLIVFCGCELRVLQVLNLLMDVVIVFSLSLYMKRGIRIERMAECPWKVFLGVKPLEGYYSSAATDERGRAREEKRGVSV